MPTIIKIDYQNFLVKNDKAAVAALTALAGAIKLESRHVGHHKTFREVYWPATGGAEISIKAILPDQIVRSDPGENDPFEEPKRLPFRT